MADTRIVVTGKGPLVSNPGPSGAAGTAYVILFARRARALSLVRGPAGSAGDAFAGGQEVEDTGLRRAG